MHTALYFFVLFIACVVPGTAVSCRSAVHPRPRHDAGAVYPHHYGGVPRLLPGRQADPNISRHKIELPHRNERCGKTSKKETLGRLDFHFLVLPSLPFFVLAPIGLALQALELRQASSMPILQNRESSFLSSF